MNSTLAIAAVLIDGFIIYLLARRYASLGWAAAGGLIFALNPATLLAANAWGPAAPATCGIALAGVSFLTAERARTAMLWRVLGWLCIAAVVAWLLHLYFTAGAVSSIDAYNLWTLKNSPLQSDGQAILFVPQYLWGAALFVAAVALVVARAARSMSVRVLVESAALVGLAWCLLATRASEYELFYGLAFVAAAVPIAGRYVGAYVLLSLSLCIAAVHAHDPAAAWGNLQRAVSLVDVAVFFYLGYIFLGAEAAPEAARPSTRRATSPATPGSWQRRWFDPHEGTVGMLWPLDYIVAFIITAASFCVMFHRYWFPTGKIFDEVYFARAAEEYLSRQYIYENTHPPITKLLITLSTWMFGGLHGGDNSHGWRFLGVVFAALAVWMLYALAKRITRSTLFSAYAAGLLALDGMHFVQARIATPETYVVFFAIATIYTFYRFWIASQVRFERYLAARVPRTRAVGVAAVLVLAAAATFLRWPHETAAAKTVLMLYFVAGFYFVYRVIVEPLLSRDGAIFGSYPDGTRVLQADGGVTTLTPDGGSLDARSRSVLPGSLTRKQGIKLELEDAGLRAIYAADGSLQYETPVGAARYDTTARPENSLLWLCLFSLSIALLVASKWYGVMAYGVAFVVVLAVWSARLVGRIGKFERPAVWGNPYGFRLDVVLSAVVFITMSVYFAAYIPSFQGLSDQPTSPPRAYTVSDVVTMQYNAYEYHSHLTQGHPYASKWYQWPFDFKPLLYYAKYGGQGATATAAMIYSLPNPAIMWMGLLALPWIAVLAWRERNKGYALLIITYLAQWLPWAASPRIAFLYHFYVDIPVICLCNTLLAQRLWQWAAAKDDANWRAAAIGAIVVYFALVAGLFVYFYPILSGQTISNASWQHHMWFQGWI